MSEMVISKAEEYISLKDRIKKEVLRRKYTGSVEYYGSSEYDFTVTPKAGEKVLAEHFNKINEPARAINPSGLPNNVSKGDNIISIDIIDAKVSIFESKTSMTSSDTGCAASCTGLCSSSCTGGCSGCGGSCSYNCSGCYGCTGCSSSCGAACASCGTCGGCDGGCWVSCADSCYNGGR